MERIELLAPAGSPEALDAAIGEGADAVYLGLRDFNARTRAKNFSYKQFECATEKLHAMKRKIYVTLNTVIEEKETQRLYNLLKYLRAVRPDGIIIQDMGTMQMANQFFPELPLHASTQMNVSSSEGVNFLSKHNVKRVVLSRELDLQQLKEIRKNTCAQLEIFIHGALCVSVSGLCLFSSYFGGKSANRGRCTQACRRLYENTEEAQNKKYYFSLNDLQLLKFIPEIEEVGINSLKIEGRMKSYQYIASVVRAYRTMIDEYPSDREAAFAKASEILKNDFARNKTEFLFMNRQNKNIITTTKSGQTGIPLGEITESIKSEKHFSIRLNKETKLFPGDHIRVQAKDDSKRTTFKVIEDSHNQILLRISEGKEPPAKKDEVFLISRQDFERPYERIIGNLDKYKHHPAITPLPQLEKIKVKPRLKLEDGYYVKISKSSDLHLLQSERPEKVIFHLTPKNIDELFANQPRTQFTAKDIILYLEPYFDMTEQSFLIEHIEKIISKGFQLFMVNNLGQLNFLKRYPIELIGGPYLYVFNSFAAHFLNQQNILYTVSPIENSKRNLYLTHEKTKPSCSLVTLFSYPELFQILGRLDLHYQDKLIRDSQTGYEFFIQHGKEKISLFPEIPFSITDKVNDLKKRGFRKFIVDLAHVQLTKSLYRNILHYAKGSLHMERTTRFNWKDGFYFDKSEETK